jgi:hypothetical protein
LDWAATEIAGTAVFPNLDYVATDGFPALDLAGVLVGQTTTHIIAAIPLEPSARVVFLVYPTLLTPDRKRLAGVDAEVIELGVVLCRIELSLSEPRSRKLLAAIGHILAAEDAEPQHLFGCEIWSKLRIKIPADRRGQLVPIPFLHLVVYDYPFRYLFSHTYIILSYLILSYHHVANHLYFFWSGRTTLGKVFLMNRNERFAAIIKSSLQYPSLVQMKPLKDTQLLQVFGQRKKDVLAAYPQRLVLHFKTEIL